MKKKPSIYLLNIILDTWDVFTRELRRVFKDPGVVMIFFVAGLAYPFLYNLMYYKNVIQEVPVAVVDLSCSSQSRDFIHKWDATPEVKVIYSCASLEEAQHLLREQKVHGIMYIPDDYAATLASGLETARISLYCDMSSFLYMKNVYLSANMVAIDEMNHIQIDRYEAMNIGEQMSWTLVQGIQYEGVSLFNPTGGYGSFLVPAVLVLILHQTLFFGIVMLCGTVREENKEVFILPGKKRRYSTFRLVLGRAAAYFVLYMAIGAFDLIIVPRIFDLPHVGLTKDILRMLVPFLLSTIFMSMSLGSLQKERETGMVTLLFTSLIFIFISGVSWPFESMPKIWQYVASLIPATWGIHGYVHINTMGATLGTTIHEYHMLWILTGVYFVITCLIFLIRSRLYEREEVRKENIAMLHRMLRAKEKMSAKASQAREMIEQIPSSIKKGK